jgi:hypothetical protein
MYVPASVVSNNYVLFISPEEFYNRRQRDRPTSEKNNWQFARRASEKPNSSMRAARGMVGVSVAAAAGGADGEK